MLGVGLDLVHVLGPPLRRSHVPSRGEVLVDRRPRGPVRDGFRVGPQRPPEVGEQTIKIAHNLTRARLAAVEQDGQRPGERLGVDAGVAELRPDSVGPSSLSPKPGEGSAQWRRRSPCGPPECLVGRPTFPEPAANGCRPPRCACHATLSPAFSSYVRYLPLARPGCLRMAAIHVSMFLFVELNEYARKWA